MTDQISIISIHFARLQGKSPGSYAACGRKPFVSVVQKSVVLSEADFEKMSEAVLCRPLAGLSKASSDGFVAKAKQHTDITELTPKLLRPFIQKIVVHEKSVKYSKYSEQTVEIRCTEYWLYRRGSPTE